MGAPEKIDTLRIDWGNPYARNYLVQYWTGEDAMDDQGNGEWKNFSSGTVTGGKGRVVFVTGEAGVGKSRLLAELDEAVRRAIESGETRMLQEPGRTPDPQARSGTRESSSVGSPCVEPGSFRKIQPGRR